MHCRLGISSATCNSCLGYVSVLLPALQKCALLCHTFPVVLCEEIGSMVELRLVVKRLAFQLWLRQAIKLEQSCTSWFMTFPKKRKQKKIQYSKEDETWHLAHPSTQRLSVFPSFPPLPLIFPFLSFSLVWCLNHQSIFEFHVTKPKEHICV